MILFTWAFKYLRKKFKRKLFPWRNTPAMETTTTCRSLSSSLSKSGFNTSVFKWKVWFTGATICIGPAVFKFAEDVPRRKMPITSKTQTNFILIELWLNQQMCFSMCFYSIFWATGIQDVENLSHWNWSEFDYFINVIK